MATPTLRPDPTTQPPNFGVGDTYSWVKVRGLEDHRDMYARATYCTNLGDLTVTMSATDVRIGGVEIVDNDSGIRCDVTTFNYEDGSYNALRVVTQDLEPTYDGVALGDTDGNMVGVNVNTSSLLVDVTNLDALTAIAQREFDQTQTVLISLTSLSQKEFNETQTLLDSLTALQENKQEQIITLLHQLTANTDEIEVNLDNLEINTDGVETLLASLTAVDYATDAKQDIAITLLHQLTANTDSIEDLLQVSNSLLNSISGKEMTISLDISAINLNTDEIESLIQTSNTFLNSVTGLEQRIDNSINNLVNVTISGNNLVSILTGYDFATTSLQRTQNTLLNTLTSNSVYGTSSNIPQYSSIVNFNSLSSVVQSDTIISLLNALTAREYDININAGDINLNTDEIEGQLYRTTSLLDTLTANSVYGTISALPLHVTGNVSTTIVSPVTGAGVTVSFADTSNLDAFGRLRVSEPKTLLDAKHLYDKLPLVFNEILSGTATSTFSANESMVVMSTVAKNDLVIRQTRHHFNYQPGKSIQAFFTGTLHPEPGIIKRVGLFQSLSSIPYVPSDGMYLEVTETGPSFNIVKNSQITSFPRSQWNVDQLNGSGSSGVTIDFNVAQIIVIDYEWLGLGRVRFGFMQSGKIYYAHYVNHINELDRPYITSPNQPVRYEIRQNGDVPGTMHHICSTIMIEGGEEDLGKPVALMNDKITGIDTNYHALIAFRLKDIAHDSSVIVKAVEVLNISSANSGAYDLILNPDTVTPPFTWADVDNTALQQATNVTTPVVVSGGYSLFKGFAPTGVGASSTTQGLAIAGEITKLGINIDGTTDVIVLAGKAFADNQKVDLIGLVKLLERS